MRNNIEEEFEKIVLNTIKENNLIEDKDVIVVAVSGGPDSMALLSCLINLKEKNLINYEKLVVAHVNHMIRKESKEETEYVEVFARKHNLECFIKYVDIVKLAKEQKKGLEEVGREERYKFFDEVKEKVGATKVAVAHNKKDNVETVLMHFYRGSGINGLAGIRAKNQYYIRPIIDVDREDIEKYIERIKVKTFIDKSNEDIYYTRNRVRNEIIPYLEEHVNKNIINTVDRLSKIIEVENDYLEEQEEKAYKDCLVELNQDKNLKLDLKKFNKYHKAIKNRIILRAIKDVLGSSYNIEKVHIDDIIKMLDNNIGNKYLMPNKNIKIYLKQGTVYVSKESK